MFFREKKTASEPILQLVENRREIGGRVCQKVVVSLGGCPVPDEYRKAVAREVSLRKEGYQRIFEPDSAVSHWTGRVLEEMEKAGKLSPPTCVETKVAQEKKYNY